MSKGKRLIVITTTTCLLQFCTYTSTQFLNVLLIEHAVSLYNRTENWDRKYYIWPGPILLGCLHTNQIKTKPLQTLVLIVDTTWNKSSTEQPFNETIHLILPLCIYKYHDSISVVMSMSKENFPQKENSWFSKSRRQSQIISATMCCWQMVSLTGTS